jgi:hypothetical protein
MARIRKFQRYRKYGLTTSDNQDDDTELPYANLLQQLVRPGGHPPNFPPRWRVAPLNTSSYVQVSCAFANAAATRHAYGELQESLKRAFPHSNFSPAHEHCP